MGGALAINKWVSSEATKVIQDYEYQLMLRKEIGGPANSPS